MMRLNRLGFCGMTLWLLARTRVPQVVLLTQQADPSQNGVYEVALGYARPTLMRVGDPTRPLTVELGAGWGVSREVDAHGFSSVVRVVDQDTTRGIAGRMRDAFAMPWAVGS